MTSPVGHTLGGVLFANGRQGNLIDYLNPKRIRWRLLVLVLVAANSPDFDFIPGAIIGEFNRYHHMATHSLMAGLLVALLSISAAHWCRVPRLTVFVSVLMAYWSHLLLDWLTIDNSAPRGLQVFWPFTDQYYIFSRPFFVNIKHGGAGDGLLAAMDNIFSFHNLIAVMVEVAVLLPLWAAIFWWRKRAEHE